MSLTSTTVLQNLWKRVSATRTGLLHWQFAESEKELLRLAEKYLRHWAWQHQRDVSIELLTTKQPIRWTLPGRFNPSVQYDFPATLPMVFPAEDGGVMPDEDRFIVCASNPLPPRVYSLVEGIGNYTGIKGIVHWQTQKQVVMNANCQSLPIGESLEECLNWSRSDYWKADDLQTFINRCSQELNADGSNAIEQSYLTFDPVDLRNGGDGDWIRATVRVSFLDCGRFGTFQICENLDFERVAAPI